MTKTIFFWSGDHTVCGSDGTMRVDGRWGAKRIEIEARLQALRLRGVRHIDSFSVGVLTPHDPDNRHAQRYTSRRAI